MFREIKNYRITSLSKEKGNWSCSIYKGAKKVGTASYNSETESYNIDLPDKYRNDIINSVKNKRKMIVNNEPLKWSIELAIIALIENEEEYENVKTSISSGFIVAKPKEVDNFCVFNIMDTAENRRELSLAYDIDTYGSDFINYYKNLIKS